MAPCPLQVQRREWFRASGWRGLFAIVAAASAVVALLILLIVPEKKQAWAVGLPPKVSFATIFQDPRFWRIAPLSALGAGVSWSLQGLWAAPWLTDVAGLDRAEVVGHLTLMAAVLSASALLLGALTERLRRAGISTEMFLAATIALSMAAELALLLGLPATQCLSSLVIAQWPADGGHYPAVAHHAAMAAGLGLQLIALGVFLVPKPRLKPVLMAHAVVRALGLGRTPS